MTDEERRVKRRAQEARKRARRRARKLGLPVPEFPGLSKGGRPPVHPDRRLSPKEYQRRRRRLLGIPSREGQRLYRECMTEIAKAERLAARLSPEEKRERQLERWRQNRARWKADNHEKALAVDRASRERRKDKIAVWRADYVARNREQLNAAKLRWYYENIERAQANNRRWYRENRDRVLLSARAYYLAHREQCLARARRWRAEHLELQRFLTKRWIAAHPDRMAIYYQRNRERRRLLGIDSRRRRLETAAVRFLKSRGLFPRGTAADSGLRRRAALAYVREAGLL